MKINWIVLAVIAVGLIILILLVIKKNQREKKKLKEFLNNDLKKVEEDEPDFDK